MTNYEAMRTMDKDDLAKFLSSIMDGKKCPASEKFCDGHRDCVDAILNWLNAESDDDTVVEHSEWQISHSDDDTVVEHSEWQISHANLVTFD